MLQINLVTTTVLFCSGVIALQPNEENQSIHGAISSQTFKREDVPLYYSFQALHPQPLDTPQHGLSQVHQPEGHVHESNYIQYAPVPLDSQYSEIYKDKTKLSPQRTTTIQLQQPKYESDLKTQFPIKLEPNLLSTQYPEMNRLKLQAYQFGHNVQVLRKPHPQQQSLYRMNPETVTSEVSHLTFVNNIRNQITKPVSPVQQTTTPINAIPIISNPNIQTSMTASLHKEENNDPANSKVNGKPNKTYLFLATINKGQTGYIKIPSSQANDFFKKFESPLNVLQRPNNYFVRVI